MSDASSFVPLIAAALTGAVGLGAAAMKRAAARDAETAKTLVNLGERLTRAEARLEVMPSTEDVLEMREEIGKVREAMSRLEGASGLAHEMLRAMYQRTVAGGAP